MTCRPRGARRGLESSYGANLHGHGAELARHFTEAAVMAELRVEALDDRGADGRLIAEPDRCPDHEDVRRPNPLPEFGPFVTIPAILPHIRVHARRDLVVRGANEIGGHAVLSHDPAGDIHQSLRVRRLRGTLQRAVDERHANRRNRRRRSPWETSWTIGRSRNCGLRPSKPSPATSHRAAGRSGVTYEASNRSFPRHPPPLAPSQRGRTTAAAVFYARRYRTLP